MKMMKASVLNICLWTLFNCLCLGKFLFLKSFPWGCMMLIGSCCVWQSGLKSLLLPVWRPCFVQALSTMNVVFLVAVWWPCFVQALSTVNLVLLVAVLPPCFVQALKPQECCLLLFVEHVMCASIPQSSAVCHYLYETARINVTWEHVYAIPSFPFM